MQTVILDTNVFLHSPNALKSFKDCEVVIPLCVIEELDNQKKRQDDAGKNARKAIKTIDSLQKDGMKLSNGTKVRIETTDIKDLGTMDLQNDKVDNFIVALAKKLHEAGEDVMVVSNDGACRVKARHFGVKSESLEQDRVQIEIDDVYSGFKEIVVPSMAITEFYGTKTLPATLFCDEELFENQFILLKSELNEKHTAMAKVEGDMLVPLKYDTTKLKKISPRNMEQRFFLEALLDPKIQLITCMGTAGTGKTLLAAAASLAATIDRDMYKKIIYYKAVIPVGKELGFLPGAMEDKLRPWMGSAYDAFELLLDDEANVNTLIDAGILELQTLTYIRGRSLPQLFIMVDEAANLTPNEIKTLVSRAGEGTKVILMGDPYQIDHPYLDSQNNGLVYTIERFKGQKLAAHITLKKPERSTLSGLAAELL